jgi:putative ABC transport system permease protein
MSLFGLIWANLFRKRTRTTLTVLSVMIAFLLFMLLRSISAAFEGGVFVSGADRLSVGAKYSMIESLPFSQGQQILALDGVEKITHTSWFGGTYQDPKNFFAQYPVEPDAYFDIYDEYTVEPPGALEKFQSQRTAAVVDIGLAERYGWKVGDVIPIIGTIYSKKDGSDLWEFELVGTFSEDGEGSQFPLFLFNYDYFYEAAAFGQGQIGGWTVKVNQPERINEIAGEIDAMFENSSNPTKTATEDEMGRDFAKQLGDIGFITTMIMSAVFFTIILLTGNTMAQALRERIPELAVLKTLGFKDGTISMLVLGEAIILCALGGLLGVGLAFLIGPGLSESLQGLIGSFEVNAGIAFEALVLMLLTGVVIGLIPAISAKRLAIVDALRK